MEKDKHTTDINFRVDTTKEFKGQVYALLPHECCTLNGEVTSYQHVGQHSSADYRYCISRSRLATKKEYADLKREMDNLGYRINVVRKQNYKKYLISYREVGK